MSSKGYDVEEIDIYEFVVGLWAKEKLGVKITWNNYPFMNMNTEATPDDAAWN